MVTDPTLFQIIDALWPYLVAIAGIIIWGIRLEGRITNNSSEINHLRRQRDEDLAVTSTHRSEMHALLTELRQDVKLLLQRNAGNDA